MFIDILSYSQSKEQRLRDLEEIFLLTTSADISTSEKKENLKNKYLIPYIENWPNDIFFVCNLKTKKTMGYLTGCKNSLKAEDTLAPIIKSYSIFHDFYKRFPAHFHINIHPDFFGQKSGSFLILEYLIELKKNNIKGAHIITAPFSRNISFYLRHGFTFTIERNFNETSLLFMGRKV